MKKFIIGLAMILAAAIPAQAVKVPENVQNFINTAYPNTEYRFDGVVILPDNTVYLPLIPSKFNSEETEVGIKYTIPANKTLSDKPDAVVLNNDYVLLKLIKNNKGKNTILNLPAPPVEIMTGLLPQDLLVPKNFIIPASMKNIIGNLDTHTEKAHGLVIPMEKPKTGVYANNLDKTPALKNKVMYIATTLSKNIQVVDADKNYAGYALYQEDVPISLKGYDTFLLVTSFGKKSLDVISLTDDKVIKTIEFKTQPEEIVIDNNNKIAYISSGEDASLYVISLETMTIKKQIRLNGMCEKVILSDDGTKLLYNDKQTRAVWAIELDNNYLLKEIGKFSNVSKIAYINDKIYITSRTKAHLAIIDYETNGVIAEIQIADKPIDMIAYNHNLYILGATENIVQVINTETDDLTDTIYLNTKGFSTNINQIEDTNLAIISDTRASIYCVLDMETKQIVKASAIEVPIRTIVVTDRVMKIK